MKIQEMGEAEYHYAGFGGEWTLTEEYDGWVTEHEGSVGNWGNLTSPIYSDS